MTAPVPLVSGEEAAAAPGPARTPIGQRMSAWVPTWPLITTKNLELRKRRGLMIAVAVLVLAPPVLLLGFRLLFHLIDPAKYGPAGNPGIFGGLCNVMAEFGFLIAAVLGAAAGTTDLSEGMFRHLVITGRSRLALYLARIPAGLAIIVPVVAVAFTMICLVTSYEGISATAAQTAGGNPAINEMFKIGLWLELEVSIGFLVGLGLGALTGQRTLSSILLIALEIILTPILAAHVIPYFLDGQRVVVGIALDQLRPEALGAGNLAGPGPGGPGHLLLGGRGALNIPPMPTWAMICVIVGWAVGWSAIGAWRMVTRDA
jgi:hypothetical protein